MRTIVISAVNIRKGGTLKILNNCLLYLSSLTDKYRIIALVHDKELAFYEGIEYIEIPWSMKNWGLRLWCEYVTMYNISKKIQPVYLWFSLHDTTPNVKAEHRAVYCQTSFPFLRWNFRDLYFNYKIALFEIFTRYAYRINIKRNDFIVVQQEWLKHGFSKMFHVSEDKFIVAPPERKNININSNIELTKCRSFLYVSTPDCHKNFELLCQATDLLEKEIGIGKFKVYITISGNENRYARWLYKKWGKVESLKFIGFLNKDQLYKQYESADCLVFPSRIETWGLPISEFAVYNKPMLLADLPYAHETAVGSEQTAFFDPYNPDDLKNKMELLIKNDTSFLSVIPILKTDSSFVYAWKDLFDILLQ
jgi:glycosyltransferase involved in cell wall biosynthesis